jgi:hypothetical protein
MLKTKKELALAESAPSGHPGLATPSFTQFRPPPEPTPRAPRPSTYAQAQSVPASSSFAVMSTPKPLPKGLAKPCYHSLNTWLADLNNSRRMPNDNTSAGKQPTD